MTNSLPAIPFTNGKFRWKVGRGLYGHAVKVTLQKKSFLGFWYEFDSTTAYDGAPWGTTREVAIKCAHRLIRENTKDDIYGYHYN